MQTRRRRAADAQPRPAQRTPRYVSIFSSFFLLVLLLSLLFALQTNAGTFVAATSGGGSSGASTPVGEAEPGADSVEAFGNPSAADLKYFQIKTYQNCDIVFPGVSALPTSVGRALLWIRPP